MCENFFFFMWDYAEKYLKRRMSYGNINALAKYLREKGKGKMEVFVKVMNMVNDIIWAPVMCVFLMVAALWFTVRLRGMQVRRLKDMVHCLLEEGHNDKDTGLSPFQAFATTVGGRVGTGNIAGTATAIFMGGPGALFWMWITAILGASTGMVECMLGQAYKTRNLGELTGGPAFYMSRGMKNKYFGKVLAVLFCIAVFIGPGFLLPAMQTQTAATAVNGAFGLPFIVVGLAMTVIVGIVIMGGIKRIGSVTEKLVPFMALFYILLALGVVLINFRNIPHVFYSIVYGAFRPRAVTGGVVGSFFLSMKKGVSRGIFSNEAGLGTGSIAHACADTRKPVKQGLFGIFEVFADTIVICTLTALVILCSGTPVTYGHAAGAELTISGFTSVYGSWISVFTAVAMCCFAFSTIIGWGLYGARCIEFLFSSEKVVKPFMVVYSLVAILGATVELGLLWSIAETFNGLMAIPNLIAVFLLSGTVVKLVKEYFATEGK